MATPNVTPAAPAAAAPAAAPSAAPAAAPASTPASSPAPAQDSGGVALSHDASVEAMLAAVAAKDSPAATDVPPPAAPAAEATATTETPAAETPEVPAATEEGEGGYSFEEDSFVGAKDLAAKLDAEAPALSEQTRNEILANSRLAEALAPYRELFGSPEEAKIVAKSAQEFARVTQVFTSIHGDNVEKGASEFVNLMLELSAQRDDEGKPMRNDKGQLITNGVTGRFLNTMFSRRLGMIEQKIKESGDDAAMAALDLVMERAGLRPSTADKDQGDPALATRKAELDAQQAEINRQKQAQATEQRTQYNQALNSDLQTLTNGEIEKLLAPATGLDGLTKRAVVADLTKAIKAAVKNNTAYQMEKDQLEGQPMSPARRQKEVALAKRFFRDHMVRIAKPILAEAGISIGKKVAARVDAQAARAENARSEVNGSTPGAPAKVAFDTKDPAAARAPFVDALKAKLGRTPSDSEVNIEMMVAAATRKSA